ncbi:hypothetical protein EUGRSUZ_E02942 [Eucalyptus grandis]|uniref:Uncharacterized protein n=2 Tax=Eucalyptus grandis TaxID=71139 RepID=A0ACC3KYA2_EUCGR|nr:hypothetical protein EUGRSUZ_E02942 [Eucalyptus grandis]
MKTGDVASGERFSPEVLGFMQIAILISGMIVEEGRLIAEGRNRIYKTQNATRHAEMEALDVLLEQWRWTGFLSAESCGEVFGILP